MPAAQRRILVIDDSPLVRSLLEDTLAASFEVCCAGSGEEGVALSQATLFDAVLCDLSMPGLSGLETVTRLKALHPLIPIIMFTESLQLNDAVEAMRLGAFGYLPKGVADQTLIEELEKAMAHRNLLERNQRLEDDAASYQREREHSRVIEQEATRHAAALEVLLESKTRQIAQLENARAQEAKLAAMGTLVAGIAHEVNNPLAVIKSGARFLAESVATSMEGADPQVVADVRATLEEVETCTLRIQRIVENLRRVASQAAIQSSCNPDGALAEIRAQFSAQIPNGITVTYEVDPAVTRVGLSREDLGLVVSHLLSNASDAIKTRGGNGSVTIRVGATGGLVTMEVEDDGCGICAEHLPQVCDPFFTTKPPGSGLGLGLSLVRQVVKNALGQIHIDSVVGRGTRIEVCIPTEGSRPARSPAARS